MAYDIGPRISLKGEAEFNKSIKQVNDQLKECGSELKKVRSEFSGQEKSVESLTRQNEVLQKQLDAQQKKLSLYQDQLAKLTQRQQEQRKALEEATQKFGENSKQVAAAQRDYDATTQQISKLNVAVNETETYCNNAKASIKENADAISKMGNDYGEALDKISSAGTKVKDVGKKMSVVSGAVVGIGVASQKAWSELDDAYDGIAAGTGATGKALEDLQASFDNVYGSFPATSEDVGKTIADLNTRFGFTGKQLEQCSEDFLKFAQVNGADVADSVALVSRAMGDAGIESDHYAEVLDSLTAASQASGISVDKLAESVTKYGAPMRALGFDMSESIALFAQWEKAGVNTEIAFSGMKKAISNWGKAGKDSRVEFKKTLEEIKAAPDIASATSLAIEAFGAKAGPDLADAIQGGRFSIEQMMETVEKSGGIVDQTFGDMLDPADQATIAMNNLKLAGSDLASVIQETLAPYLSALVGLMQDFTEWFRNLPGPVKEMIVIIGGLVAGLGPLILVIGTVMEKASSIAKFVTSFGPMLTKMGGIVKTVLGGIGTVTQGLFSMIMAHPVIAVITVIIAALVTLYTKCEWFRDGVNAVFSAIGQVTQEIFQGLVEWFTVTLSDSLSQLGQQFSQIGQDIQSGWDGMCQNIKNAWNGFWSSVSQICSNIMSFFQSNWQGILTFILNPFVGAFKLVYDNCEGFRQTIDRWCSQIWSTISGTFSGMWDNAKNWGRDLMDGFIAGINSLWDGLKSKVRGVADLIGRFLHFSVPEEGPLSDFDESGGDMMELLIDGIESKKRQLADTIRGVADSMTMDNSVMVRGGGTMTVEMPVYLDGRQIQRSVNTVSVNRAQSASIAKGGR